MHKSWFLSMFLYSFMKAKSFLHFHHNTTGITSQMISLLPIWEFRCKIISGFAFVLYAIPGYQVVFQREEGNGNEPILTVQK